MPEETKDPNTKEESKNETKGTYFVDKGVADLGDEAIGDIDEWIHKSKNKDKPKGKKNEKNKG
jgi:hypothetical protein